MAFFARILDYERRQGLIRTSDPGHHWLLVRYACASLIFGVQYHLVEGRRRLCVCYRCLWYLICTQGILIATSLRISRDWRKDTRLLHLSTFLLIHFNGRLVISVQAW